MSNIKTVEDYVNFMTGLSVNEDKRQSELNAAQKTLNKDKSDFISKNTVNRVIDKNATLSRLDYAKAGMNPYGDWQRIPGVDDMLETANPITPIPLGTKTSSLETGKLTKFANKMKDKGNTAQAALDAETAAMSDMGMTAGDIIGLTSSVIGSVSQMATTIQAAKATKPVVNHYAGFNDKALAANQNTKDQIGYNKDIAKKEIERKIRVAQNSSRARLRNGATSINSLRGLDLATDIASNESLVSSNNQLEGTFGQQMLQALSNDVQLLSQKDQMVAAGQTAADEANAANLDNFYSNFAENIAGATTAFQQFGANVNKAKQRNDIIKLIPQSNKWGIGVDKNMKLYSSDKYSPSVSSITENPIEYVSSIYED